MEEQAYEPTQVLSIRIPKLLHERLIQMAKEGHRSLNGQINMILEYAVHIEDKERDGDD